MFSVIRDIDCETLAVGSRPGTFTSENQGWKKWRKAP